ncbi:MAG: response regulator [Casimicrobiaceae bacterium]
MRTVLVVDDETTIADALASVLQKAGYTTRAAYDGAAALEVIGREPVDLVLTDLVMTGMDGATLIRWLRSAPETTDLPVILMSMLSEERVFALCSDYSRFLRKPLQFDALFAAIEELCDSADFAKKSGMLPVVQGFVH